MTPEGRVKNEISKMLARYPRGYKFMPVQHGYGKKTLDYLLCINGRFVAIEAKAPGKKPTALQESCMREITAAGGTVFVIDDVTALGPLELFLKSVT